MTPVMPVMPVMQDMKDTSTKGFSIVELVLAMALLRV